MLTQLSAWLSGSTSRATRRASRRRETTLAVETLERREVFDANPLGDEFAVNTVTTGPQVSGEGRPTAMAMDDAGNYVVVWTSPDSRGTGVFGQRFNADGTKRGEQFQINTNETGNQYGPRVAMDADGDFVVTWYSDSDASSSNFAGSVRRYNNLGEAQGDEFALDASIDRYQRAPAIAMDADGDFVIVSMEPYVDDNNYGIVARRFNSAGEQQGSDIVVNTYNFSSQQNPDVAMDDAGNFVVTWMSTDQDGSSYAVAARRFDAAGVALDAQDFIVNTTTTGFQGNVSVAMDADGDFIITWEGAGDGDGYGIFAQRFNAAGGRVGGEFVVNAITTTSQTYAAVAMDGAGNFVVTWSTSFSAGTDTDGLSVAAQAFLASGQRLGNEFQANTTTTSYQAASGAALNSAGDLVIVWLAPDGSNGGYFGQRYHLSLNSPPTDVSLSNNTVVTGSATGAVIGVLTGTDPNAGDSLTFTIQNDPDAKFAIVGNELRVNGVLDYETATSHSVTIRVFDGEYSYDKVFTINVTNVPLSPPDDANGATNAVLEGAPVGTVVGLTALAGDGAGAVVYSLTNNAGGRFTIDAATGVVTTTGTATDFESSGGSYQITVQATDGAETTSNSFTIAVTNVAPSAPIDSNAAANTVAVGAAAGAVVGVIASATDPSGGSLTYALTNSAGGRFTIDSTTGVVSVASGATFTGGTNYTITVQASDGTAPGATSDFTITTIPTPIVMGTNGADAIKVGFKNEAYIIKVNGALYPTTYPAVTRIEIYGLGGNDYIEIDSAATASMYIDGGDGNDTILGGAGNDVLLGGAGADSISGYRGRDLIIGGLGKDVVKGAVSGATAADAGILIGDATAHDADQAALLAISAAWAANDATTVRTYLKSGTVPGDGLSDAIKSSSASNDLVFSFELKSSGSRLDDLNVQTGDAVN